MQLTFSLRKIYVHVFLSLSSEYTYTHVHRDTQRRTPFFIFSLHSDASAYFFLLPLIFTIFLPMAFIVSASTSISGKFASFARKSTLLQNNQQVPRYHILPDASSSILIKTIFYRLYREKLCLYTKRNSHINIILYRFKI